jgi:hypothetical protein
MFWMKLLFGLLALNNLSGAASFTVSKAKGVLYHRPSTNAISRHDKSQQGIVSSIPRGGALKMSPSAIIPMITSNLQGGPYGIFALSAVTWSVVLPLTLFKKVYGIGVAYGFSVMAAGYALLNVSTSTNQSAIYLAKACIFYGARLGGYLLRKYN